MKKILSLFAAVVLLASCNSKKVDYAVINIDYNGTQMTVNLTSTDSTSVIKLKDGKYTDTLRKIDNYYYLVAGDNEIELFVEGGDNVAIKIDATKGIDGITFSGEGAKIQEYLLGKKHKISDNASKMDEWYKKDESTFKKNSNDLIESLKSNLKSADLSDNFTAIEKQSLDYSYYILLNSYANYHEYLTGEKAKNSPDFLPKEMVNMDFNNETNFNLYRDYRDIALNHYMSLFYKNIDKKYPVIGPEELAFINDIKMVKLRNNIVEQCSFFMNSGNSKIDTYYDELIALSNDNDFKRELTAKYQKQKNLSEGKMSPEFAYSQPDGNILKLSDLRGKFVYIDVWATWCEPCKKELPALKDLEEKLKGKNIVFVSISVDSPQDKEVWMNMIKEKEMGGYQLFSDNTFNSFFIKEYAIDAIPRFIFIDKEGKIISADAPRPSSPETVEYLTNHIN